METITFMTSLLAFYLKGEIKAEQNFLKLKNRTRSLHLFRWARKGTICQ